MQAGLLRSSLRSHPFVVFLARRLIALVFLALGISVIAFTLTNLVPADPVVANLGVQQAGDPQIVKAFRERYGLDKPLPVQYELFLIRLVHGDLGISEQTHRPVTTDLAEYIPASAELAAYSIVLAVVVGMTFGSIAAIRRNRPIDQVLRVVSLTGTSMPTFWLALVVIFVFYFIFGWFPDGGRLDPTFEIPRHVTGLYTIDGLLAGDVSTFANALWHLVLPASVLAAYNVGLLTRFTRAAVLDVLNEDYVGTARAKGLPEITVFRHIIRGALPPVVTLVGFLFAETMSGTVLVETIFAWPGVGRYAFQSATTLDLPAIMGVTLFVAVLFITTNLVVDVLYGVIDPRLRIR